jgi:hypothetical protein
MSVGRLKENEIKMQRVASIRSSVCFPLELHDTLEQIANRERFLAWIVHDAVENVLRPKGKTVGEDAYPIRRRPSARRADR